MLYNVMFISLETDQAVNLNDGVNTFIPVGVGNDLMPPFTFQESKSPLIPGSLVSAVRIEPRELALPVMILDVDHAHALARARSIIKQINPLKGEGVLRFNFSADPNQARVLYCRYKDGFTSDGTGDQQFSNYIKAVLIFKASDPLFYTVIPTVLYSNNPVRNQSFFPVLPIRLASSANITSATLENAGDVPAWPLITIHGPGSRFIITNQTTGKYLDIPFLLEEGQRLIIDTRPRSRSVRDGNGINRFAALTPLSSMWSMNTGSNYVTLEISGGNASTYIMLAYIPAYLTV